MPFFIHTLGCPKNEVDSQGMAGLLLQVGHQSVAEPHRADLLIVNTCGFIDSARRESLQAIRELAALKRPGQKLVAAGCLAQRYEESIRQEVPAVDAVVGTQHWQDIGRVAAALGEDSAAAGNKERGTGNKTGGATGAGDSSVVPASSRAGHAEQASPCLMPSGPSAYLKIADGCSAACAFCVIPLIKGPYRSKPAEQVIAEARALLEHGVQEIVLIAQDVTAYGYDWGQRDALAELLERLLAAVPQIPWLRLMYAYPTHVSEHLIRVIAAYPQICHYLDLPLQHAHPAVLRRMGRPSSVDAVRDLLGRLRQAMPDIALRTSFIVGFPGETEEEFATLLHFVREMRFDRLGGFVYSPEEGAPAATMPQQIPLASKRRRYARLMTAQQEVSLAINRRQVGRRLAVLVEGTAAEEPARGRQGAPARGRRAARPAPLLVGRSYRDAPEVDGLVFCRGDASPGDLVEVAITGAMEYDLVGTVLPKSSGVPEPIRRTAS